MPTIFLLALDCLAVLALACSGCGQVCIQDRNPASLVSLVSLVPTCRAGKWGYADENGKIVIPPQYYWVDDFSEGLAHVEGGKGNTGYIDRTGKFVIRRRFWGANPFTEGLAGVQTEVCGRWGLIDKSGRMRIQPKYDKVGLFSEGLAAVRIRYKWGYIDTSGKAVIACKFMSASPFSGGVARVTLERKRGRIDKSGKFVADPERPKDEPPAPAKKEAEDTKAEPTPQLEGSARPAPKKVSRLGNPYRKRYPDGGSRVFSRNIRDMILYKGRIYIGAGDYWSNTGPVYGAQQN